MVLWEDAEEDPEVLLAAAAALEERSVRGVQKEDEGAPPPPPLVGVPPFRCGFAPSGRPAGTNVLVEEAKEVAALLVVGPAG